MIQYATFPPMHISKDTKQLQKFIMPEQLEYYHSIGNLHLELHLAL